MEDLDIQPRDAPWPSEIKQEDLHFDKTKGSLQGATWAMLRAFWDGVI